MIINIRYYCLIFSLRPARVLVHTMNIKRRMLALGADRLRHGHKPPAAIGMPKKNASPQSGSPGLMVPRGGANGERAWSEEKKVSKCISFSQECFNSVVISDDGQNICFAPCTIPCHP